MISPKRIKTQKMGKTKYNDLMYIKLSEILTRIEIDYPEKMEFITNYLHDRFNVIVDKDDLIVIEPLHAGLFILFLYDLLEAYVSKG